MNCPLCDSSDWTSVEKNKDGVNLRVQCDNCGFTYSIRFRSESLEYRLAGAFSNGHLWREGFIRFTAYGMEMESGELVLSTDPELLLEWFAS
jgi:transposase-like protein